MIDVVLTAGVLLLTIVLVVAGGLLVWAHTFVDNEIHNQLAAEQIYFPAANSAVAAPGFKAMRQYGGQQLTTGARAEVYADHLTANDLKTIGDGKTYAQLSADPQADPTNTMLAVTVDTVFKGQTLRGLPLNAYAFGTMATIAAIAAVIAAALTLALSVLGLVHIRRGRTVALA